MNNIGSDTFLTVTWLLLLENQTNNIYLLNSFFNIPISSILKALSLSRSKHKLSISMHYINTFCVLHKKTWDLLSLFSYFCNSIFN